MQVFDELGRPVQRARLSLVDVGSASPIWRSGSLALQHISPLTDENGASAFELSRTAMLQVYEPQTWPTEARAYRRIEPGSSTKIELRVGGQAIILLDATRGGPVSLVEVEISTFNADHPFRVTTQSDAMGKVRVPPGFGKASVTLTGRGVRKILSVTAGGVVKDPSSPKSFTVPEKGDVTLALDMSRISLFLSDAAGGGALSGRVQITQERRVLQDGVEAWRRIRSLTDWVMARDGHVYLDPRFVRAKTNMRTRLVIDGYCAWTLSNNALERGEDQTSVVLTKSHAPIDLQLVCADGLPFTGSITAIDLDERTTVFTGNTDNHGGLAIKGWCGARLGVETLSPEGLTGELTHNAERPGRQIVTLNGRHTRGGIVVHHSPDECARFQSPTSLVAIGKTGIVYPSSTRTKTMTTFKDLPIGNYVLGTPQWSLALVEQGVLVDSYSRVEDQATNTVVPVSEATWTEVPWNEHWVLCEELRGRVILPGLSASSVKLIPFYGATGGNFGDRSMTSYTLDEAGTYSIPAGSPKPTALVVHRVNPGILDKGVALAVLQPGESLEVPLVSFSIEASGTKDLGTVTVLASATPESRSGSFQLSDPGIFTWEWDPSQGSLFGVVTSGIQEFVVTYRSSSGKLLRVSVLPSNVGPDGISMTLDLDRL